MPASGGDLDVIRRLMPTVDAHGLTKELDDALSTLAAVLRRHGARATPDLVTAARRRWRPPSGRSARERPS